MKKKMDDDYVIPESNKRLKKDCLNKDEKEKSKSNKRGALSSSDLAILKQITDNSKVKPRSGYSSDSSLHSENESDNDSSTDSEVDCGSKREGTSEELKLKEKRIKELQIQIEKFQNDLRREQTKNSTLEIQMIELKCDLETSRKNFDKTKENNIEIAINDLKRIQAVAEESLSKLTHAPRSNYTEPLIEIDQNIDSTAGPSCNSWNKDNESVKMQVQRPVKNLPGSYKINKKHLHNCRRTGVIEFTNDILEVVFTDKELATCTVTGKACNANKDSVPRAQLDPVRYNAALNAAYKIFGKLKSTKSLFNHTASNKCGKWKTKYKNGSLLDNADIEDED